MSVRSILSSLVFRPKLLDCLPGYNRHQLGLDVASGITVGVLALPLAMAFAIASGCTPTAGIWTAIVAGLIISALGGSRVQIGGPTGAFIPIVYGIVVMYGFGNLLIATMLAGVFLLIMGFARLGQFIRFIPVTVVIGFTNGIAVVIFMAQLKDFMGLDIEQVPAEFFGKVRVLATEAHTVDLQTLALSTICLIFLLSYGRISGWFPLLKKIPGQLLVLVLGTVGAMLAGLDVETIGSRFNGIPQEVPPFSLPPLSLETLGKLISPAITIALLGAIESLLSARVADGAIDDRHDPNQELIAQGLANIAAPLFGGFAATGAIARTTTNVRAGGRTPVAGIVHALVLMLIVLVAAPLAEHVPLGVLSAIVMVTAINMGEWHEFKELRRYSVNYRTILLATFLVTVIFDLTIAVELGMLLACLFFIYRMSELTRVEPIQLETLISQHNVVAYGIYGSLFFGAINKVEGLIKPGETPPEVFILDASRLIQLDTTGLEALENLHNQLAKVFSQLIICGLNPQPGSLMLRSGFIDAVGEENVCDTLARAEMRANTLLHKMA
ncbi:MAG: sulfate permease [Pseudomonadota bacterium]|jgi:SulP family sulfate permease